MGYEHNLKLIITTSIGAMYHPVAEGATEHVACAQLHPAPVHPGPGGGGGGLGVDLADGGVLQHEPVWIFCRYCLYIF